MNRLRGYTGGTFDLFHPGHVSFLRTCRDRCDHLTVGLNTDEFASNYKRTPVMNYNERLAMLASCRYVDAVICNVGNEDSSVAIAFSGADLIFHGDDWTGSDYMRQLGIDQDWLDEKDKEIIYIPYSPIINTSDLIERIKNG